MAERKKDREKERKTDREKERQPERERNRKKMTRIELAEEEGRKDQKDRENKE